MSPIIIEAHRGDSFAAPENTLAAFQSAVALKAPSIELDVHPTADGVLAVIHDDRVDRTTNGSGTVCDLTFDELRHLDAGAWFAPQFAGERIPRLEEVLELLASSITRLNVEIKSSPPGQNAPRTVVDLLRRAGKAHEYVVSSFDLAALLEVQALAPEIVLALIGHGPEILPLALQHHLEWIHAYHATLTEDIVIRAHAAGLGVNVWTVDEPAMLAHWSSVGVDKLCTNRLALMLAAA